MGKKEKLIRRLLSKPKDFTFDELVTLMECLGCQKHNAGKTSGSRVQFNDPAGYPIRLHRPHPGSIVKEYQLKDAIQQLKDRGLLP